MITWVTLLAGCRTTANVEWAEFAAKAALDLDPNLGSVYVMLSNVYLIHYIVQSYHNL